jgi:hypothetical protein
MSPSSLVKCSDDPCGRQVTLEISHLDLLRRASIQGDLQAWSVFQQSLESAVLTWLHAHPGSEAVCHLQSERHFVTQASEQLWQATIQGQLACERLSEVLVYLRASLNGVILQTLRDSNRPATVSSIWPDGENSAVRNELWDWLQAQLPNQKEQRLAYLLYHCGLEPAEIVRYCPLEWSDVHEVARLRRSIFVRLMKGLICEGQTFV